MTRMKTTKIKLKLNSRLQTADYYYEYHNYFIIPESALFRLYISYLHKSLMIKAIRAPAFPTDNMIQLKL